MIDLRKKPPIHPQLLQDHGDDIKTAPPKGCGRIALQNANGVTRGDLPAFEVIQAATELDIDIYGITEPNVAMTPEFKNRIDINTKRAFGRGFNTCTSTPHKSTGYLPGGIIQMIRGNPAGRHHSRGTDQLGRYSWNVLRGANDKLLCIITAYRVCQRKGTKPNFNPKRTPPKTAHWQQTLAMIDIGINNPDPRTQILSDLSTFMNQKREEGCEIYLMMDANEDLGPGSDMAKFIAENSLEDVHQIVMGLKPDTSRAGSNRVIDAMLCSSGAVNYIKQAGYCAIDTGLTSDHILLWADFDFRSFFGGEGPAHVPPQCREFSCSNEKVRDDFILALSDLFADHKIEKKIDYLLMRLTEYGGDRTNEEQYNNLDNEIVDLIKTALAKTVKQKQHGDYRSPLLTEAGLNVLLWKSVLLSKTRNIPITKKGEKLAARANVETTYLGKLSANQTNNELRKAWKNLNEGKKHAAEARQKWLESVARIKAASSDKDGAADQLNIMLRNMEVKRMHRKLTLLTKGPRSGLDFIQIPTKCWYYSPSMHELYHYTMGVFECHRADTKWSKQFGRQHTLKVIPDDAVEATVDNSNDAGPLLIRRNLLKRTKWQRITDKKEIERLLLQRNKRHLQQMTKEGSPPSRAFFQDVLNNYGNSETAEKILEGEITDELDEFPQVLREWLLLMKRTTHERSVKDSIDGKIDMETFQEAFHSVREDTSSSPSGLHYTIRKSIAYSDTLSTTMSKMMSMPFRFGIPNHRWMKCIDVMIEKKKNIRQIHQLRIIGLLEADFNTALKIYFAKHMITNSEGSDLTEEQWGGRPGRTAHDPALRKLLTFEYARAVYVTIALFANDATACFDRMVPAISTLIARKHGATPTLMKSRNIMIEGMEHQVKTKHGISAESYKQNSDDDRLAGEIQGKADPACLWSVESQTILKAHQKLHKGISLPNADGTRRIEKNNDAFVDDDDAAACKRRRTHKKSAKATVKHLQRGSQIWSDLISGSGGSIAFHKCFWTMAQHSDKTLPPKLMATPDGEIHLKDEHGMTTKIKKLNVDQPNKGLGCRQAADGNMKEEFSFRKQQCNDLANRARGSRLSCREAHLLLHTRILKTVTYSMPVTSFTTTQCKRLNTIIDKVMLNKLGLNRNMPKIVLYSPLEKGGMNYPSFSILQDQLGIINLIKQLRWNKTIANDILVTLSAIQFTSGMCTPVLMDTSTNISYVPPGWLLHIRSRLNAWGGTLWIEHQWNPELQRLNDSSIMETLANAAGANRGAMEKCNMCRLYSRVITLSDIAHLDGTHIPHHQVSGNWRADSTLHLWPMIPKPPPHFWTTYRSFLRKSYCITEGVKRNGPLKLKTKLGPWRDVQRHIRHTHLRTETYLYSIRNEHYVKHVKSPIQQVWTEHSTSTTRPIRAHPIHARKEGREMWTRQGFSMTSPVPTSKLHITKTPHDRDDLAGSDGSVDPITGDRACSSIIHFKGHKHLVSQRFSPTQDSTSYRAELEGIYNTLELSNRIEAHGLEQICDNQEAINKVNEPMIPRQMTSPEADIILACKELIKNMKKKPLLIWERGHQDKKKPYQLLTQRAQLNVDLDKHCGEERTEGKQSPVTPLKGSGAMLAIDGTYVTTKFNHHIQTAATKDRHKKYFLERHKDNNMTTDQYESIAWKYIGRARNRLTIRQNSTITKLINKWLNVGHQKEHMGKEGACPTCGWHDETQLHMYQCTHNEAKKTRKQAFLQMREYLKQHGVPTHIGNTFVNMCESTCNETQMKRRYPTNLTIEQAVNKQRLLPKEFILRGLLTNHWLQALIEHDRDNAETSMIHLLLCVWNILFTQVWGFRNGTLHGRESIVDKYERRNLIHELREWKREPALKLGSSQTYLTMYDMKDVPKWQTEYMKTTIEILTKAARNYRASILEQQHLITEYFTAAEMPPD